jgi:hypothetical protein
MCITAAVYIDCRQTAWHVKHSQTLERPFTVLIGPQSSSMRMPAGGLTSSERSSSTPTAPQLDSGPLG